MVSRRHFLSWALILALAAPAAALQSGVACLTQTHGALLRQRPATVVPAKLSRAAVIMAEPKSPNVSKQALVDAIAVKAGVSKKTASIVLGATLDVIVESVCEGHKVSIVGFGSFTSKHRPERQARNPKTGEKMIVPEATVPSFTFGKSFKDAVKASDQ